MRKSILSAMSMLAGAAVGATVGILTMDKRSANTADKTLEMSNKHLALFVLMDQWVKVKQEGKNLASYFEGQNYKAIAIYGMGRVGERLLDELKDSNISVKYGIDRNAKRIYSDIKVVTPDDDLEDVDAIVVTPVFYMDEIEKVLSEKISCSVISLEDVLCEV